MTKFQKTKKLVSRHTKDFQAISEHILLQNCGVKVSVFCKNYKNSGPYDRRVTELGYTIAEL